MTSGINKKLKEKIEENFDKIEAYLKEYPNSNAMQIADGTGISVYEIISCLTDGRLIRSKGEFSKL